jgi:predicted 3-demethylubiquinone-9 3-methyltransferase (glyoxalase superfamily)
VSRQAVTKPTAKGIAVAIVQKITPYLWFDNQAEEAAKFYVSLFKHSAIGAITRYGKEGFEVHGRPDGSVVSVSFWLVGQYFTALNGGSRFTSLQRKSPRVNAASL